MPAIQNYCSGKIKKVRLVTLRLYINETPPLTFSFECSFFFGQAISQNSSKPLIVKGFYLVRMSFDYCFRKTVQGQLSQCNRRNTATVLRAVVKSHNGLKGKKVFACGCSGRISKIYQNLQGRARAGVLLL